VKKSALFWLAIILIPGGIIVAFLYFSSRKLGASFQPTVLGSGGGTTIPASANPSPSFFSKLLGSSSSPSFLGGLFSGIGQLGSGLMKMFGGNGGNFGSDALNIGSPIPTTSNGFEPGVAADFESLGGTFLPESPAISTDTSFSESSESSDYVGGTNQTWGTDFSQPPSNNNLSFDPDNSDNWSFSFD
jgi:hypothetical protein